MLYSIQYTKSDQKKIPLLLRLIALNHKQEPVIRPNGMNFYQWFYCSKGKGQVIIDGEYHIMTKGKGFLLFPHTSHSYQGLSGDWTVHIVGFEGMICKKLLQALGMNDSGIYFFKDTDIFLKHVQNFFFLKERKIKNRNLTYSKECYSFLVDIAEQITPAHTDIHVEDNSMIRFVISYLEENFSRDFSIDEVALAAGRSKEYLCTIFKKATGKTIIRQLTEIRILHAKALLLQDPGKTVTKIAMECGFSSASYFGKKFRLVTGYSPDRYRKNFL